MKKKLCVFVLVFVCVLMLFSCQKTSENNQIIQDPPADSLYSLVLDHDSLYMLLKNEIVPSAPDNGLESSSDTVNGGCLVDNNDEPASLAFTSVSELKEKILSYALTAEELEQIATFERDGEGRIPLWNMSRVCEPALPSGVNYSRGELFGANFRLILQTADGEEGIYCNVNPDAYRETLGYERLLIDESMRVYQTEDRNATVIENKGLLGTVRRYMYEISGDSVTYTVGEIYYDVEENSTVPDSVYIYMETDYECYYVEWYGLTERPSVEWLTSFGVAHTD